MRHRQIDESARWGVHSIRMRFREDQQGQDVTEYGLLLGFIFLVSLCIYLSDAWEVGRIWNTANTVISQGSSSAQQNRVK